MKSKIMPSDYFICDFSDEKIIEVTETNRIILDLKYSKMPLAHSTEKCYIREQVYEKLLRVSNQLPYEIAHEKANGVYDISIPSEWIYPVSGLIFTISKIEY